MVQVEQLSKRYGRLNAVSQISFRVEKGEVVGLLGPNGAGKSTTLRILAGYLPPTSGAAQVAGFDVFRESVRAREHIGYMPENVPLPPEMRVIDYLAFRGRLKGVPGRRLKERLVDTCEMCRLVGRERAFIGNLSKGYRQRVGLADALINEPDLLILDEPTIGLDPGQIRQVRELIRVLSRHHTILLSTHILPEVEVTCSRAMILAGGRIQAEGTPQSLREAVSGRGAIRVEMRVPVLREAVRTLGGLPGVEQVEQNELPDGWCEFLVDAEGDVRSEIFGLAVSEKWVIRELTRQGVSLEDAFIEATETEAGG